MPSDEFVNVRYMVDDVEESIAFYTSLVGMALLYGYELTIQIMEGGRVLLKPLP